MGNLQTTEIKQIEIEINFYKGQAVQSIFEIGERLIRAKELVEHGEWGNWLKEKVDFSHAQANNFMRVAKEYSNSQAIRNLGQTKVFAMLALPKEEREAFVEDSPVEDMTTRELRKAIKEKKDAEQRAKEIEKQLADMRNEAVEFKQLLEKERVQNTNKPKEVVHVEVVPDEIVQQIGEYKREIADLEERAGNIDKAKMELAEYKRERNKIAEEMAELRGTMRQLHDEYKGKNQDLTKQSLVINKFRSSIQPIKKAKGELEQAFNTMTNMSKSGKAQIMSELEYLYDFADFVGGEVEQLEDGEVFYNG